MISYSYFIYAESFSNQLPPPFKGGLGRVWSSSLRLLTNVSQDATVYVEHVAVDGI